MRMIWPQALAQTARAGDVYLTEPSPLALPVYLVLCFQEALKAQLHFPLAFVRRDKRD